MKQKSVFVKEHMVLENKKMSSVPNVLPIPFNPNAPMFDKCGQEIKLGCIIVYGHALGRCAALKFGKVVKVLRKIPQWVTSINDIEYRISVVGVEDYSWKKTGPELSRMGTLQFPDRCVVIPDTMLPLNVKTLLDKVSVP